MSSDSPLKHEREDLEALEEEKVTRRHHHCHHHCHHHDHHHLTSFSPSIPLQADKRELLEEAKEASILEGGLSTRLLDSRISSMVATLPASELGAT